MPERSIVDAIPLRREPADVRDLLQSSLALLRQQAAACDISMTVTVDDGANQQRTALGLLLMRDIVLAHGGSMDVESQTDDIEHGTTVHVRLPVRGAGSAPG